MSGLEALGVAASVIQVADLGTKLSVKLFSFYRQVKNANLSIQNLSSEIALTSAILRELGESLKTEGSWDLCSEEAFKTLTNVLDQCQDVLGQIQKLVIENKSSGKSGIQQVTEKFRLILLEPKLDPLKQNLERLKSTMLLLLNVIMYAGLLKNKNVPNLLQEQRHLLESLVQKREEDSLSQSSTIQNTCTISNSNENLDPFNPMKSEASRGSLESDKAKQDSDPINSHPELKDYSLLIQKMLREIDCCKHKLENTRHSRIKTGILNIHSGEIVRFQMQHGSSIPLDYSLFAENNIPSLPPEGSPEKDAKDTTNPIPPGHSVSVPCSMNGFSTSMNNGSTVRSPMQYEDWTPLDDFIFAENKTPSLPPQSPPRGGTEDTDPLSHGVSAAGSTGVSTAAPTCGKSAASSTAGESSWVSPASPSFPAGGRNDVEEKIDSQAEFQRPVHAYDDFKQQSGHIGSHLDQFLPDPEAVFPLPPTFPRDSSLVFNDVDYMGQEEWASSFFGGPTAFDDGASTTANWFHGPQSDGANRGPLFPESRTGSVDGDYSKQTREEQSWDPPPDSGSIPSVSMTPGPEPLESGNFHFPEPLAEGSDIDADAEESDGGAIQKKRKRVLLGQQSKEGEGGHHTVPSRTTSTSSTDSTNSSYTKSEMYSLSGDMDQSQLAEDGECHPQAHSGNDDPQHGEGQSSIQREDLVQPINSAAALTAFEKRAQDLETHSLSATIDHDFINTIDFGTLTIEDRPSERRKRRPTLQNLKRRNSWKRQASNTMLCEPMSISHTSSHQSRLSLSSPSLSNALSSMEATLSQAESINQISMKPGAKSQSTVPDPLAPRLIDSMTAHSGPPVNTGDTRYQLEPHEASIEPMPSSDSRAAIFPENFGGQTVTGTSGVTQDEDGPSEALMDLILRWTSLDREEILVH